MVDGVAFERFVVYLVAVKSVEIRRKMHQSIA